MTRTARVSFLIFGLGVTAILVSRAGPRFVWSMLVRTGWSFVPFMAIYALHLCLRAAALSRSALGGVGTVMMHYTRAQGFTDLPSEAKEVARAAADVGVPDVGAMDGEPATSPTTPD